MSEKTNDSRLNQVNGQTDFQHTPEQKRIIDAEVGNMLVSAAAGSGKTAVLTDRIVSRLISGEVDIRQLLVMTFTDAAAGEMKIRIEKKLYAALRTETSREKRQWINRQISWLPGASVSTIHAFCLRVIKDFVHLLKDDQGQPLLDASFSVDDGIEAELLLEQSLAMYLQQIYEQIDQKADAGKRPHNVLQEERVASGDQVPGAAAKPDAAKQPFAMRDSSKQADHDTGTQMEEMLLTAPASQMTDAWIAAFYRLMDGFGGSRTDQPVRDLIIRQYHYLRSLPDYQALITRQLSDLERSSVSFSDSTYARSLFEMLRLRLERAGPAAQDIEALFSSGVPIRFIADPDRNEQYLEQYQRVIKGIKQIESILKQPDPQWDAVAEVGCEWNSLALPRANRHDKPEKKTVMSLFNQFVAELVYFVSGSCRTDKYQQHFVFDSKPVFTVTEAEMCQDIKEMLPVIQVFYSLVLGLDDTYRENKRSQGFIDFADFEHLALALLRFDEVRNYYLDQYREIYIDEYQDTSSIQEAVIQSVSRQNCVMVGDLKQSIYRFRHARPQIFKTKADSFRCSEQGLLIELNRNFRSVENVLLTINHIFEQLMSQGAGEIDYDERQALIPHRRQENSEAQSAHLLILDDENTDLDDDTDQAKIDEQIQEGHDGTDSRLSGYQGRRKDRSGTNEQAWEQANVYEKETLLAAAEMIRLREKNSASWSDFALLCRTRHMMQSAAAILQELDLPVLEGADAQRFDIPELRLAEAMIYLCDNAKQDLPLAAVMRSSLPGMSFSDDELAKIKTEAKQIKKALPQPARQPDYFHQAVSWYQENGRDKTLAKKLNQFCSWLNEWRQRAVYMRVDEWLRLLMSKTQLISRLSAGSGGAFKTGVMTQLISLASSFEQHQRRGLHHFSRYLESLRQKEKLGSFFTQETHEAEGIRVMTIHGSKGLEFPVVFLIGSQYRIVPREPQESLLISEHIGIGFDYVDPVRKIRYASHPKLAMLAHIKASGMAEELRLFYVALTRARDQFYITAVSSLKDNAKRERYESLISQARQVTSRNLPDHVVLSCRSYLEWLLLVFARGSEADAFMDPQLPVKTQQETGGMSRWDIRRVSWSVLTQSLDHIMSKPDEKDLIQSCAKMPPATQASHDAGVGVSKRSLLQPDRHEQTKSSPQSGRHEQAVSSLKTLAGELEQRITSGYRYSAATRAPVKLTVSEIKRLEQQQLEEEPLQNKAYQWLDQKGQPQKIPDIYDLRGINQTLQISDLQSANSLTASSRSAKTPVRQKAGGAAIGTLLHHVFRYLNLPSLCEENGPRVLDQHLDQMLQMNLLTSDEHTALSRWQPDIWAFVCSGLAAEMRQAASRKKGDLYQEMPFTLAVPVQEIYPDQEGFARSDRVLIQGMIDCWFKTGSEITLVDFKSDKITGSEAVIAQVLRERYRLQLKWYARALETSLGQSPGRCIIWHIRSRRAYLV